jgi:transcription elongation factor GreA
MAKDAATIRDARYKMSAERLKELQEELLHLQTVREKEIAEQLKEARSFGDLSENSEYDEAKTEQGKIYSRKAELIDLIENAELVEVTSNRDAVGMGSRVTIFDPADGAEEVYQIVGSQEADPGQQRISDASPIGRALLGGIVGETVVVDAPAGKLEYKIIAID